MKKKYKIEIDAEFDDEDLLTLDICGDRCRGCGKDSSRDIEISPGHSVPVNTLRKLLISGELKEVTSQCKNFSILNIVDAVNSCRDKIIKFEESVEKRMKKLESLMEENEDDSAHSYISISSDISDLNEKIKELEKKITGCNDQEEEDIKIGDKFRRKDHWEYDIEILYIHIPTQLLGDIRESVVSVLYEQKTCYLDGKTEANLHVLDLPSIIYNIKCGHWKKMG